MLYQLLMVFYIFIALFILLLVFIQPGKNSMGLGYLGGSNQMLFGGSGGQNIFQKLTWTLGLIFMGLSLWLALLKTSRTQSRYFNYKNNSVIVQNDPQATEEDLLPEQSNNKTKNNTEDLA